MEGFDVTARTPLVLILDVNFVPPSSKIPERASGLRNQIKGQTLSHWWLIRSVQVLNEPGEWFAFHGLTENRDVDVATANRPAMGVFEFSWEVDAE